MFRCTAHGAREGSVGPGERGAEGCPGDPGQPAGLQGGRRGNPRGKAPKKRLRHFVK